jgi:hypothetical protein
MECKRRWEIATTGFDEYLSTVGGDPDGQSTSFGLRVPTLATPVGANSQRYIFNGASFSVGDGACARIIGWRQFWSLGYAQPVTEGGDLTGAYRVVEQEVTSTNFRLPDGNVSFHMRTLGPPNAQQIPQPGAGSVRAAGANCSSFIYNWADTPALLFGTGQVPPPGRIYTNLTSYVAPNSGRLWGTGIVSKQGTIYELRTPYRTHGGWTSLDIPITGPDTVAFLITVRQSDPSTRPALVLPATFYPGGLSPEEQFLQNFPSAIIWRVGVALIVEEA